MEIHGLALHASLVVLRARGRATDAALREAQLALLDALRAGTFVNETGAGRVAIPEQPVVWAGLQLWGEPE